MIELAFTVCLLASPERCDERRLTFAETISTRVCMTQGQAELARWSEAHPKWRITRWKCRAVRHITLDI